MKLILMMLALVALTVSAFAGRVYRYNPALDGVTIQRGDTTLVYTADQALATFGEALEIAAEEQDTMDTTWTCTDGTTQHVVTHQRSGEAVPQMAKRHHEKVEALQVYYPTAHSTEHQH